jgi:DNA polymerase-3 subunit epsilon
MTKFITPPQRLVVFDVETTGLSPEMGDRVVEIGAVALEDDSATAEFSTLIQVPVIIPYQVSLINGITNEMLIGQPGPEEVFPAFREFIGGSTLVAHNIRFDLSFLKSELARLNMKIRNKTACTLEISRSHLPRLPNHRLETVARHLLGKLPEDAQLHRALGDARLTARIWLAMNGFLR